MNDIRRTILWVIFGFSMVLLWDQWQVHNGRQPTFIPAPTKAVGTAVQPAPGASGVPAAVAQSSAAATVPAAGGAVLAAAVPVGTPAGMAPRELIAVSTDVLKLTFDSEGGSVVRAEFLRHKDMANKAKNFVLLDDSKDRVYLAQSGLIGAAGVNFPTHKTAMVFAGPKELKDGDNELEFSFTSPDVGGVKLVKTYTLKRSSYAISVRHLVTNTSAGSLSPQLYLQLVRDGNKPEGESAFYSTFTGPAVYTEAKKYQKIEFTDIKKKKADFEKQSTNGYIAMVQHYFASAWVLPDGLRRDISLDAADIGSTVADCCYRASMIAPLDLMAPGATKTVEAQLFAGPQEEKTLESLAPGLELVKDYGWLTILAKPLYWLLDKLHGLILNWGWAIVGLVCFSRLPSTG